MAIILTEIIKLNHNFMAKKGTSSKVASKASKILKDGRTSAASKSVAAVLYPREKNRLKKGDRI